MEDMWISPTNPHLKSHEKAEMLLSVTLFILKIWAVGTPAKRKMQQPDSIGIAIVCYGNNTQYAYLCENIHFFTFFF